MAKKEPLKKKDFKEVKESINNVEIDDKMMMAEERPF